jgi:S-adenosylmethionine/arginine decarboxylase-like enzyme
MIPIYTFISDIAFKLSAESKKLKFDRKDAWGYLASIDLIDCDPDKVRDKKTIEKYIKDLSEVIKCHLYGPPTIARIGEGKRLYGWSFTQLVTTSSITGHFIESNNTIYIDIFFCNYFDPDVAAKFTKDYFKARAMDVHLLTRGKR